MTITTPEQMREAAMDACKKVADEAKSYGIPQMTMAANTCYDAIRAIPIAPQPVAVTVKPLVFSWRKDDDQNPSCWRADGDGFFAYVLIPFDAGYDPSRGVGLWNANPNHRGRIGFATSAEAMAYCEASIREQAEGDLRRAKWAMDATIQPADPLSDPRVKALVKAANDAKIILAYYEPHPLPVLGRLLDALRAIGGEA